MEENKEIKNENVLEQTEQNVSNTGGKNKKKVLVGVVVGVVLLCVLSLGGFYLLNQNKVKPEKAKTDNKEYKSEYRLSGNSLEDFDLYFMKLENEEKNKVYSPLSIKYALEMLAEGASGETKKQLDAVIGDYVAKSYPNNDHMSFANAMFIRNTFKENILSDYTTKLTNKYGAEVVYDEFNDASTINNWVSGKTFKLIENLVDDSKVKDANFYLVNALAIDMNWTNQIHCTTDHKIPCVGSGTYGISYLHEKLEDDADRYYSVTEYPYSSEDEFYERYDSKNVFNGKEKTKGAHVLADFNKYDIVKDLGEDKIKEIIKPEYEEWLKSEYGKNDPPYEEFIVDFINDLKENYGKSANSTDFSLHEDDNVRVFAKDLQEYEGMNLQYIGIMPKTLPLVDFVKNTNKKELNDIINKLKVVNIDSFEEGYVTRIRGFIPFFKFEYELSLMEDLQKLGIKDVFDVNKANLTKMLGDGEKQYIGDVKHKANIEFSNDGIKASAATAMGGFGAAGGPYFEHLFKVPVKNIDVTFDKPYMYLIRDKATGEVWFTGTVYEPIVK